MGGPRLVFLFDKPINNCKEASKVNLIETLERFDPHKVTTLDKATEVISALPLSCVAEETLLNYQTLYKIKKRHSFGTAHPTTIKELADYYDQLASLLR